MSRAKAVILGFGIALAICIFAFVVPVVASGPNADAPDIDLVALNPKIVKLNVYGEPSRDSVRVFVNNEVKPTTKTNQAEYVYRTEFPIRYVKVTVKNQTGKSVKEYKLTD